MSQPTEGALPFTQLSRARIVLAIVAATVVVYGPGATGFFVSDDFNLLLLAIRDPISTFNWVRHPSPFLFFRPVPELLWRLNYAWFGTSPVGFHLTNIGFHAASAVLVAAIAWEAYAVAAVSLVAGVLFAVHPFGAAVVSWLSGRYDGVATFFMLLAVWSAAKHRTTRSTASRGWFIAACLLALASKESAVALPLVLFALASDRLAVRSGMRGGLVSPADAVLALVIVSAYLVLRLIGFHGLGGYGVHSRFQVADLLNPFVVLPAVAQPWIGPPGHDGSLWLWVLLAAGITAVMAWRMPVWIAWLLLSTIPALNLMFGLPRAPFFELERFFYFGLGGLAIAVAAGWWRLRSRSPVAASVVVALLVAGFGARTLEETANWKQAARLSTRVEKTFRGSLATLPAGSRVDCSDLPDNLWGAYSYRNGCEAQMRIILGKDTVSAAPRRSPGSLAITSDGGAIERLPDSPQN